MKFKCQFNAEKIERKNKIHNFKKWRLLMHTADNICAVHFCNLSKEKRKMAQGFIFNQLNYYLKRNKYQETNINFYLFFRILQKIKQIIVYSG